MRSGEFMAEIDAGSQRHAARSRAPLATIHILLCLALAPIARAHASPPAPVLDARALNYHRNKATLGVAGMSTLTAWALANLAGGAIGNFTTTGSTHYFHQGNAAWNSVNLVLGVVGVVNNTRSRRRPLDLVAGRRDSHRSQVAFIVNAGLDVLYLGAGAAMWQLGPIAPKPDTQARLVGYGQALVLQGAFLFAFDVAMAIAHQRLRDGVGRRQNLSVAITPRLEGGAMLGLRFQR